MANPYDEDEKPDPMIIRCAWAVLWSGLYGAVWWTGYFRPADLWVNAVIIAAIWIACLPPRRVRLIVGGIAEIAVAAVILFAVQHELLALVLFVFGGINIVQGYRELSGPR